MCSITLSIEERVVRARAQCGMCARIVEEYSLQIARQILYKNYGAEARVAGMILDEFVQPRVSRQVIDPFGNYDPRFPLAGYLPKLVELCWKDFWSDRTDNGGLEALGDDLRPNHGGEESEAPAWDVGSDLRLEARSDGGELTRDHMLFVTLRQAGFDDRDCEIIRLTYAEGWTANDVADAVSSRVATVGQVTARFRDLCIQRPVRELMSAAGFPADSIWLVVELFTEHLFALRRDARQADRTTDRWESRLDERRCLDKIAKDRRTSDIPRLKALASVPGVSDEIALTFLKDAFEKLLASSTWSGVDSRKEGDGAPVDPIRLGQLRSELRDRLRNDEDWLRHELSTAGIPEPGVDAYLRLWGNQQIDTVFRVAGETCRTPPRPAVLGWLAAVETYDPRLIQQLPHKVRRWYFESRRC